MRDFIIKGNRLSEKQRRNLSILDAIRRSGEISRAEISKETDLNIVTVSNYVTKYVKDKLVIETGLDISSGGRRPELLKLNPEYAYSVGIDLGAPHLTIGASVIGVILDVNGKIVAKEQFRKEKESFENLSVKVVDMVEKLITASGISLQAIRGIGVGIWGVLDRYRGMVRYAVEDEQIVSYQHLLDQLETKFDLPAVIEHDSALAAFGEKWSGIGASGTAEDMVFMCSDSSCGLIIRGELYNGASSSAGELNLNPPYPGEESSLDKCWASYDYGCCMRSRGLDLGMVQRARQYMEEHPDQETLIKELTGGDPEKIDFDVIADAAGKDDGFAKGIMESAGEYLGTKIAYLINIFNPELVVIGRGIDKAGDIFFSAVRKAVRKWAYEETVKVVKILPTSLGEDTVAIGAAGIVTQNMFINV